MQTPVPAMKTLNAPIMMVLTLALVIKDSQEMGQFVKVRLCAGILDSLKLFEPGFALP